MRYRSGLEIKKKILEILRSGEFTISYLERKIRTSDKVLKRHLSELQFLGIVNIIKHSKSSKTGRPYTTIKMKT